jgi:predicted ATPase
VEFDDTDHYQMTRTFLENPERMLRELMDGGEDA